jgi:hypothetical protein
MRMPKQLVGRRVFLQGAGGFTLALPVLRSLMPRDTWAGDPPFAANPRFVAFATEHGGVWEEFMFPASGTLTDTQQYAGHTIRRGAITPTVEGGIATISPVLSGAADILTPELAAKLSVLRGLDHPFYIGHHRGGHLGNYAENDGNGTDGQMMQAFPRPTIDQVMAWSPSFYPDLSSILERSLIVGDRISWGWSSPESGTGTIQEMPPVFSSLELFNRIFVPEEDDLTSPRPPVVDRVLDHYRALRQSDRRLSAADRQRIDDHLERLDELQRRLEVVVSCGDVMPATTSSTDEWSSPSFGHDPEAQRRFWQLHNDVVAAAFVCGTSRIAVLRVTDTFSDFQGDWHEPIAHQAHVLDGVAQDTLWRAHQRFFEGVLLDLARKLDIDEGDGITMLDNTLVAWTQESGLFTHESVSTPVVTFGSAAGEFQTGQYLDYRNLGNEGMYGWNGSSNQRLNPGLCYNQWLGNVLTAMGVPKSEFESGEYGGYGEVFIGDGRAQFYPSAVFDAAGDVLPWLGTS